MNTLMIAILNFIVNNQFDIDVIEMSDYISSTDEENPPTSEIAISDTRDWMLNIALKATDAPESAKKIVDEWYLEIYDIFASVTGDLTTGDLDRIEIENEVKELHKILNS